VGADCVCVQALPLSRTGLFTLTEFQRMLQPPVPHGAMSSYPPASSRCQVNESLLPWHRLGPCVSCHTLSVAGCHGA